MSEKGKGRIEGRFGAFVAAHPRLRDARKVGVAVSGGGDSVALAVLAAEKGAELRWAVTLLHVNYGLRGADSDADEDLVEELARRLGCEFRCLRAEPETRTEEELREIRYRWFAQTECDAVLTGHTLEDQAETVLFRMARGSGPGGLAGILPVLEGGVFRPLLGCRREELRNWLRERGVGWREDGSNEDARYRRNVIRHRLLPAIEAELNPAVQEALATLAEICREEEEWLQAWTAERLVEFEEERMAMGATDVVLRLDLLREQPRALQRRLLLAACEKVRGYRPAIEFLHVEAMLELAGREAGDGRMQAPGLDVMRSFDWLRIQRGEEARGLAERNYRVPFPGPGLIELPFGAGRIRATVALRSTYNGNSGSVDWRVLRNAGSEAQPLEIRNWRPGDHYLRPLGNVEEKVKELFQRHRIPLWQRRSWPIVVLGDSPVWVKEFGPAAGFEATAESQEILEIQWLPEDRT